MKYLAPLFFALYVISGCASLQATNDEEAIVLGFAAGEFAVQAINIKGQMCERDESTDVGKKQCANTALTELEDLDESIAVVKKYKSGFFSGIFNGVDKEEFDRAVARLNALEEVLRHFSPLDDFEIIE